MHQISEYSGVPQEEDAGDLEGMEGEDEAESSGDDGGEPASGGFTAAKQRSRDVRANASGSERSDAMVQRLLEEYYKLDYEDNIAGMPTHFHYKQVLTRVWPDLGILLELRPVRFGRPALPYLGLSLA